MEIRICIDVDDLERGIAFYAQGLGLRTGRRLGNDWVELLGAASPIDLLANPPGTAPLGESHPQRRDYSRHWTPLHLDIVVEDLDTALERATAAGARAEGGVREAAWGRIVQLADPFGHGWCLLQFVGRGYDEIAT